MSETLLGVFDAVIFDFDGTLADSHASMMRAYRIFAEEYGIDFEEAKRYTGMPTEAVARILLPADVAPAAGLRIDELESSNTEGVVPLPGAVAALDAVPQERLAIATSCTDRLITARMAAAGLPLPDVTVTRDMVVNGKPAPDSFLLAAERLGVDPARCVVLEDAPAGVRGAREAGCATIGIRTHHTDEELGADWCVDTLADLTFENTDEGVRISRIA